MTAAALTIDFEKLTPIESMFGEDVEATQQLAALCEEAELYLASSVCCEGVRRAYFGLGVSDLIGIFLFEIAPRDTSCAGHLWVVVGDVPPAHFGVDDCPGPVHALQAYIRKMKNATHAGREARLMRRIQFLESEILRHYREECD